MTVYAVALSKGGTSKTALSSELVRWLATLGGDVLAIDLDQQGNLTARLGVTLDDEVEYTAADVLRGDAGPIAAAVACPRMENVGILVGAHDLNAVSEAPPPDLVTSLRDTPELVESWDDVVIDTPPALGGLTQAALAAADVLVVPVATAAEAWDQIERLEEVLKMRIRRRVNPDLRIDWVVPTLYDGRRRIDREIEELLRQRFPDKTTIPAPEAVVVKDSYTARLTVGEYAPGTAVADAYEAIAKTIITGGAQ